MNQARENYTPGYTPSAVDFMSRRTAMQRSNGGDVFAGRKLAAWLRQAQFARAQASAAYEIYPSAALIADYLAQQLDLSGRDESAIVLRNWAKESDAMFAQAWFEAIGYKD